MWAKVAFLTLTSTVIPLVIPRQYIAVDIKVSFCVFASAMTDLQDYRTPWPFQTRSKRHLFYP
jgi:hypothetical protein